MKPSLSKKVLLAGAVIALLLAASAPQADAWWGRCCGWGSCGCSSCGWGGCGWGGCGWRGCGCSSCGWSGCCNSGCSGCGNCYSPCSSCCGTSGAPAESSAPADAQPAAKPTTNPASAPPAPTTLNSMSETGTLSLHVPADARVIINGYETQSKGTLRGYTSRGLKFGYQYEYTIEVRAVRDGHSVAIHRTVYLQGGQNEQVEIALPTRVQGPKELVASAK
jgi:uncharacterized protein (TIGR03000 family)